MNEAERCLPLDVAKGIGIVCVLLGHSLSSDGGLGCLKTAIYAFHLPLFFFVSGVVSWGRQVNPERRKLSHSLFDALLYPYLFFSVMGLFLFQMRVVPWYIDVIVYVCLAILRYQLIRLWRIAIYIVHLKYLEGSQS